MRMLCSHKRWRNLIRPLCGCVCVCVCVCVCACVHCFRCSGTEYTPNAHTTKKCRFYRHQHCASAFVSDDDMHRDVAAQYVYAYGRNIHWLLAYEFRAAQPQ